MTVNKIKSEIITRYNGLFPQDAWGETSFFYNPDNSLPRGTYFMTIKEKDGKNDSSSKLNRGKGFYRLNPSRPAAGNVVDMNYDFSKIDEILPHPIYGWMTWICVIIDESYQLCLSRYNKKKPIVKVLS
jgi:hypothetical protein